MALSNHNVYICEWLEKIQSNLRNSKLDEFTNDEKIDFIQQQYHLMMLIHRALNGQVLFVGAKPIGEQP
jgi:hypothetical protein